MSAKARAERIAENRAAARLEVLRLAVRTHESTDNHTSEAVVVTARQYAAFVAEGSTE